MENKEKRNYTSDTRDASNASDACVACDASESSNSQKVATHYRELRTRQTVDYVKRMHNVYFNFDRHMNIWDAFELLNQFVDSSDPDLVDIPNIYHAFQTAEGIRKAGLPEHQQLVGLIHDLGKMLFVKGCDEDGTSLKSQYGVGGDTFIVGCKLSDTLILPQYNALNPDMQNALYNTDLGIYAPHCGFSECMFSFGHDEYLYQVLVYNRDVKGIPITLPEEDLYTVRFHSFYPWHQSGAYAHLASEYDRKMQKTLQHFTHYDLYTKSYGNLPSPSEMDELKSYYTTLMLKYLGGLELWF